MKKIFFILLSLAVLLPATQAIAAEPKIIIPDIKIKIPGMESFQNPQECEPGKLCIDWLGKYIEGIYNYGIIIMATLAMAALAGAGFLYIFSAGDKGRIGTAQKLATSGVTALIIIMSSYLLLYQIDPSLTILEPLKVKKIAVVEGTSQGTCVWQAKACQAPGQTSGTEASRGSKPYNENDYFKYCCCDVTTTYVNKNNETLKKSAACNSVFRTNDVVNYSQALNSNDMTPLPAACSSYDNIFDQYGTRSDFLRALAATESTCKPAAQSPAGACGLMQIMPDTARKYISGGTSMSSSEICQTLKNNPAQSVDIAWKIIAENSKAHEGNMALMLAGYNGGYATKSSKDGTPPLAPSNDCPGNRAFECCIDPGGLSETQDHVMTSIRYYNWARTQ